MTSRQSATTNQTATASAQAATDESTALAANASLRAPAGSNPRQWPSGRVLGTLVAAVFAVGVLAGAALGPAPESSLASGSTILQRVIALLAARASEDSQASAITTSVAHTSQSEATSSTSAPAEHHNAKPTLHDAAAKASAPSSSEGLPSTESTAGPDQAPSNHGRKGEHGVPGKPIRLPPIQHVWLIMLGGSTLADATAAPASHPYLTGQLFGEGELLTSYSALDAYEMAGDATLLPGGVGASLSVISEPGCDGAPPAQAAPACPQGAQPSPVEADAFLQKALAPILAGPAYRENGLVVVTFGLASQSTGVAATTIAPQPPAGALLLSPLLHAGTHNASPFNSLSPRTSLATIFKR